MGRATRVERRAAARGDRWMRLHWVGYTLLAGVLVTIYLTMLSWGNGIGVDYACFRAAAHLLAAGGNPWAMPQLWATENQLYNAPHHLHAGLRGYYIPIRYFSPPLFATLLRPLAALPFTLGYTLYALTTLVLAIVGGWCTLRALDWQRSLTIGVGVAVLLPPIFLTAWYGQQSTLLFCAVGAALLALRRERPTVAGALLAIGWVKPHLLIPVALLAPLALPLLRDQLRVYAGFLAATVVGLVASLLTSGAASVAAWAHLLIDYSSWVDSDHVQSYLPSLSGMSLVVLPHPLNRAVAVVLCSLGFSAMAVVLVKGRRTLAPWTVVVLLTALWALVTPFVHAHDEVLLLPALALAWNDRTRPGLSPLPVLALWSLSLLSLAFVLPYPLKMLGVVPPLIICLAALQATGPWLPRQSGSRARAVPHASLSTSYPGGS